MFCVLYISVRAELEEVLTHTQKSKSSVFLRPQKVPKTTPVFLIAGQKGMVVCWLINIRTSEKVRCGGEPKM